MQYKKNHLTFTPGRYTTKAQRHEDFRSLLNKVWCLGVFVVKNWRFPVKNGGAKINHR